MPAIDSADDVARTVSRLRAAGHSPDLVSAVVGQARLRTRARAKFGDFAERMLFTRAGLEQATRLSIAGTSRRAVPRRRDDLGRRPRLRHRRRRARPRGARACGSLAVDADEVTAAIAAYNLAPFGADVVVRHARAEEVTDAAASGIPQVDAYWLDPARRTAGHTETSRTRPEDWSPSLDWVFDLAARHAGRREARSWARSRRCSPPTPRRSGSAPTGSTIELVLWSGALARRGRAPGGARRARRRRVRS